MEPGYRYEQAEREIEHLIRTGRWGYGEFLPSRERLAADIGMGIRTTRRALDALADPSRPGGALVRKLPGAGTVVIFRREE